MTMLKASPKDNPFKGLKNVGPATRKDFELLQITSLAQLAACDPDELYIRLRQETQSAQDPCCWDVFAAAIHQARTGEGLDWWAFTKVRKARQLKGDFPQ